MRHLETSAALVRFYFRMIPYDWYRRRPFLPMPPRKYLDWRFQTAYGGDRPSWTVVLRDIWQFGSWLRDLDSAQA